MSAAVTPDPLASVDDLAAWLGEELKPGTSDWKRAHFCLRAASALVRQEAGKTWLTKTGALDDPPEGAVTVTLYCASRVYENRTAQTRSALDDFSDSWKVGDVGAYLTDWEKRTIAGLRGGLSGIFTVPTTRVDDSAPSAQAVPVGDGDGSVYWY